MIELLHFELLVALREHAPPEENKGERRDDAAAAPAEAVALADRAAFADIALAGETDCLVVFGLAWSSTGTRLVERAQRVATRHALAALAVDVEASPELARRCRVTAAPSLLLFRNGQEIERRLGEVSERDLEDWITLALAEDGAR